MAAPLPIGSGVSPSAAAIGVPGPDGLTAAFGAAATAGQMMYAFAFDNAAGGASIPSVAPPAGWTEITPPGNVTRTVTGAPYTTMRAYSKAAVGGETGATFTWTSVAADYAGLIVVLVDNAGTGMDSTPASNSGSSTAPNLASAAATRPDVLWLAAFVNGNTSAEALPVGDTSGFTLLEAAATPGSAAANKVSCALLFKQASAAGQVASVTTTISGGVSRPWAGIMLPIPAPGGGGGGGGSTPGQAAAQGWGMPPSMLGFVQRAITLDYFGDVPAVNIAQWIGQNFDMSVHNVDTNPATNAVTQDKWNGFLDDCLVANPAHMAAPYKKGPQIDEGATYFPNNYYAHVCPFASGAKITTFSPNIFVAQPSIVAGQSPHVDPRGWTSNSFKEQRARDTWAVIDRYNTLKGTVAHPQLLRFAYIDSMGTSSYKGVNCDPASGSPGTAYNQTQWLNLIWTIADEMRTRGSGRMVIANGLITGGPYFGGASTKNLLNHCDGGLAENWLRNNFSSVTAFPAENTWQSDVDMVIDANTRGKLFWGIINIANRVAGGAPSGWTTPTAAQMEKQWRYSVATYFLADRGFLVFEFVEDTANVKPWTGGGPYSPNPQFDHPYLHVSLGTPIDTAASAVLSKHTEAAQPAGNTLYSYRRRWAFGCTWMNPTAAPVRLTFDRDYKDPAGVGTTLYAAGSTFTLAANSGLLLITQDTAPPNAGAPIVTITGPPAAVTASVVSVSATVTDPDGIASVEARVGTSGAWTPLSLSGGVWVGTLTLASGANTVQVRATDANASPLTSTPVSRTVTYTPNAGPPVVTFIAPATSVAAATQLVQVQAVDPDGVDRAYLQVNGGTAFLMTFNSVSGFWEKSVTLLEGTNTLSSYAFDNAAEPQSNFSSPTTRTVTVTTPQPPPQPPPAPDPDPGQITPLGVGKYRVWLFTTGGPSGGGERLGEFTQWTQIDYGRGQNVTTDAALKITGADKVAACAPLLAQAATIKCELAVYRNGALRWVGPVTRIQLPPGGQEATINARDLGFWLSRRMVHSDHVYNLPGTDVATIASDVLLDAMTPDPRPGLVPEGLPTGLLAVRSYLSGTHQMADSAISDLDSAGLRWTIIGRKFRIMPAQPVVVTSLLETHFAGGIGEDEDGLSVANLWGVRGAGAGQTDPIYAQAQNDSGIAEYGLLEQVADATEIADLPSALAYAGQLRDQSSMPVVLLSGGDLLPSAPINMAMLLPHNAVKVSKQGVRPITQERIIQTVTFSVTPQSEKVTVAFEDAVAG